MSWFGKTGDKDTGEASIFERWKPGRIGFDSETAVAPQHASSGGGERRQMTIHTIINFRPKRLIIPAHIARYFVVIDFHIGRQSVFLSSDALPAMAFVKAVEPQSPLPEMLIGMEARLIVQNASNEWVRFGAWLEGEYL